MKSKLEYKMESVVIAYRPWQKDSKKAGNKKVGIKKEEGIPIVMVVTGCRRTLDESIIDTKSFPTLTFDKWDWSRGGCFTWTL